MLILIKNAELYSPEYLGKQDILIGGTKILRIQKEVNVEADLRIDASGLLAVPGIIDAHVHIAGAGGEGGPYTRTPEMPINLMIEGGLTGIVGCLGTDGMTRNLESVLMKVKAIREAGLNAWMYTGAYQVPTPTFFGDVGKDIALIDEIIGVGEIAISDHRSSWPSVQELRRIAAHARVGGMLGAKSGILNLHMGDAKNPFQPIEEVVKNSEISYKQFLPTHCNRNHSIFQDAKTYAKKAYVDLTTSSYPFFSDVEIKPSLALKELLNSGVPEEHITFTSDANGSLPSFNHEGELVKLEIGKPDSILNEIRDAVFIEKLPITQVLKVATSNVAKILKLKNKGNLKLNFDADLLLLNKNFELEFVIANGNLLMDKTKVKLKQL